MGRWIDRLRSTLADLQVFASPRTRRRFLRHLAVAFVVVLGATVLLRRYFPYLTDTEALRSLFLEFGVLGPLALVVLQALQVVLAPVPGQVLAVVGGYLYGAWWGTLYNVVGIAIGSTAAFWLSRRFGRPYVEGIVDEDLLARFDSIDDDHVRLALFVLFLVPGLPDDAICFLGGLTRIPLWHLVALAVVGRAPSFFLVNVVGGFLGTGRYLAAFALAAALTAISLLAYLVRGRILDLVGLGN
jgi:uncharacterized membrane protein YdjX (TVP38/TMEM64 family)